MVQLEIRALEEDDSGSWQALLAEQSSSYRQDFAPFRDESRKGLQQCLSEARKDGYWGVWKAGCLAGFFMLRGWDEGYERPSFGILIDEAASGIGLGRLCLQFSITECRIRGTKDLMLKVAAENIRARHLYESMGFTTEEVCPETGHLKMNLALALQP
ncbi:MAG: GNAT family N-acetyltransferase [Verrucomicrobiota bacterium]